MAMQAFATLNSRADPVIMAPPYLQTTMAKPPFTALNIAVLTVSDTRTPANDTSGDAIQERMQAAGHKVVQRNICKDDLGTIRAQFQAWVQDPGVDVIISTGGTGVTRRDVTPEAVRPLITKPIPGFGELFRMLSFDEINTSAIQSRAEAGIADNTIVFVLPGSPGACRLGVEKIILPQLDASHRPCNLAELLPRIRYEPAP